ncbi:MAG: AAC(3) family N-acetyltransferase [Psychrilyobacter sp.]|uniref:aminoglycoside N(3)-acetyltransferase n=1 Tax=Psychrilyobacter sp. TaxID=2586924 RepID=UPI003C70F37E
MSEKNIIDKTKIPITKKSLLEDLEGLGIEKGDTLLVHSSLSSLGWVCGGAQSVIMVLIEAVGEEGTIVMPTHSGDWSDPVEWGNPSVPEEWHQIIYDNMPAYDPDITPTRGMGGIPELFRTFPNVIRSSHPQVSFCASGKFKEKIIANHQLTPQFGMESPLGVLYNLDKAKVLLLGVGYDSCTSFHLGETLVGDKVPMKRNGTAMMVKNKRSWEWFDDYEYDADDFPKLGKEFEDKHQVINKIIGNAECKLFSLKEAVDFSKEWLLENR